LPPFGHFALQPAREKLRCKSRRYKDTVFGRAMISYYRKKAIGADPGPFDVNVEFDIYARLYPNDNRTEKRAMAGPQIWEAVERRIIEKTIKEADSDNKFVFVDAGANVGLYGLYAEHYARENGKNYRVLAVEPSGETLSRLKMNIAASKLDIEVGPLALSNYKGRGQLSDGGSNRGQAKLTSAGGVEEVGVDTLFNVCQDQKVSHIDILKMDIEDHEEAVLDKFFNEAPASYHPEILILETRREPMASALIELCHDHNYLVFETTRQNSILKKNL